MDDHYRKVQAVAASVKRFYDRKQTYRIFHGPTNSTRQQALKDKKNVVDTSSLNRVLKINPEKRIAIVEPNVSMDRLVEATLAHNCIPPVTVDFPGITAGGGYAGTACESSSFKHGFFDRTINRIEMVIPNGEILSCSDTEHADLFRGAAAAMGTLGVVTLLEIKLVEATKYVETTYHPVFSIEEAVQKTKQLSGGEQFERWDYVDAIIFSQISGVIITGRRTNERRAGVPVQRFSASTDPWYAWHVQTRIGNNKEPVTELIPLPEYLFRYDRAGFWVGYSIVEHFPIPFTTFWRRVLDPWMHTRMLYAATHSIGVSAPIVQDMAVPYSSAVEFVRWSAKELAAWPLWLCPLKQSPRPTIHPQCGAIGDGEALESMLNVGIWGNAKGLKSWDDYFDINDQLDAKLFEVGGQKWMYGVNMQNDSDFWRAFDKEWYDALRAKYHAEWMLSIADKARTTRGAMMTRVNSLTPLEAFKLTVFPGFAIMSMWRAWRSEEWKWKRESTWMAWVPRE